MTGLYRSIQDYIGLYRTIQDSPGLYRTLQDYIGLYKTTQEYIGLYRTIEDYADYTGIYKTIQVNKTIQPPIYCCPRSEGGTKQRPKFVFFKEKSEVAFKTETLAYLPVFVNMKQLINVMTNLVVKSNNSV